MTIFESQYIEYKESWQDQHFKTICAFANTEGGFLFIGIDDNETPMRATYLSKSKTVWNY